ncbi:hypothetical protein JG687_00005436 [Phytophthora cactorum]|uniref:HTH CENPB-type domain-containing protein n=1 Tax=Phytophthora cactorum TaxID=29920 RepID=A0A8T1UL41_9STRA|nr:hypothetical protein JG687_00005436 [Phytophthora cactorum]
MVAKTRTAQQKRFRHIGTATTLSDDAEMDILEWLVALRSNGVPVSAKMIEQEALEVAALYNAPRSIFAATPTWIASYLSRYSLSLRAKARQGYGGRRGNLERQHRKSIHLPGLQKMDTYLVVPALSFTCTLNLS